MEREIVYVDMDDVLCDYEGRRKQRLLENPKNSYPQAEYGFFRKLEEIPGAVDGINQLAQRYDTWILTAPSTENPFCYTEKRVWVEEHLGMKWVKRLIINPEKSLNMGDYLIDDKPWPKFKGRQLLFGYLTYPTWKEVLEDMLK